jgi:hypothetical protein
MLNWLQCVLEAHFLSRGRQRPTTPRPGPRADAEQEAHHGVPSPEPDSVEVLAGICRTTFPLAYRLWIATVT